MELMAGCPIMLEVSIAAKEDGKTHQRLLGCFHASTLLEAEELAEESIRLSYSKTPFKLEFEYTDKVAKPNAWLVRCNVIDEEDGTILAALTVTPRQVYDTVIHL